jgi:hypothetical protein
MKLVSLIEVDLSTVIIENGAKEYKVYHLEPTVPCEVLPDAFAQKILNGPFGGTQYFTEEQYLEKFFDGKPEADTPFTKENLQGFGYERLFGIAKEAGLNPNKFWKHETLVNKVAELTAPVIE